MKLVNLNNTLYNENHIVGIEMPQYDEDEHEWYFAVILTNEIAEFIVGDSAEDCMKLRTELLLELGDNYKESSSEG